MPPLREKLGGETGIAEDLRSDLSSSGAAPKGSTDEVSDGKRWKSGGERAQRSMVVGSQGLSSEQSQQ